MKNFIIPKHLTLFLLLAILALAAFFRFYQLADIPPGLYPDVAINGNDAINALKSGDFKLFYPENNGREGLFINLIALSFWIFGASVWAIKIVPAIFGLLTVLGVFFLTKQLFSYLETHQTETIALLSTFFITVSFWHVNFSRLGFRAIMAPFFLVWSFYFLFKGLETAKDYGTASFVYFPLAGLLFGLGFHTYIAFRVAPLILLVPLIFNLVRHWPDLKKFWHAKKSFWSFIKKSYSHDNWLFWDLFLLAAILAALPLALYFWQHPVDFIGRSGQVSIFASENPIKTLLVSAGKTLGMFNIAGDCNWRHNFSCQPLLFWPIGFLFLYGLITTLANILTPSRYKKNNESLQIHWLLIIWFGAMLLPAIMTNEGLPHALRVIGAIPPVFIWAGLGAWQANQQIKKLLIHKNSRAEKNGLIIIFAIFFLLFALAEFTRYFIDWGQNQNTRDAFTQRLVDEGKYLHSLPGNIQKYVLVNESGVAVPYPNGLPMPAQTIIFFNRETPNIKYFIEDPAAPFNAEIFTKTREPIIVLPIKPDDNLLNTLQQTVPAGRIEKVNDFRVFKINY